ncbi:MAG TPA: diacylglycerol kinase family protein [Balneolales bacterium]|nr:diacylglycerol kinase family protein [Balneolales bacterium]
MGTESGRRFCFIFNPSADRWRSSRHIKMIENFVNEQNNGSKLWIAEKPGDLRRMAADAAVSFDVVVACGGDGTIREIITGVGSTKTILGVVPTGSGNDFVKSLGIPKNVENALTLLGKGKTKDIDIGCINNEPFINTIGIGFDGLTNYYASKCNWLKGELVYVWAALKAMFRYRSPYFEIQIDDNRIEKKLLMVTVANGKVEGGTFWIAPDAQIDDGLLDVAVVDNIKRWMLPYYLLKIRQPHYSKLKPLMRFMAKKITVDVSRPIIVHADGEVVGKKISHLDIHIAAHKIPFICGDD